MKVTFVRHGQSLANIGLPFDDHTQIPLTAVGHDQAAQLSKFWTRRPDRILLSSMLRTHLTAAPTIARFPTVPVEEVQMEEFTYLEPEKWKGSTWDDRRPEAKAYWDALDPDHVCGPGAESFTMLMLRVVLVLTRVSELSSPWTLAFTHGQFMQAVKVLVENPQESMKALMGRLLNERLFDNTECFTLELNKGRWACVPETPSASSLYCGHANEMPYECPCSGDCYCKAYSCRMR